MIILKISFAIADDSVKKGLEVLTFHTYVFEASNQLWTCMRSSGLSSLEAKPTKPFTNTIHSRCNATTYIEIKLALYMHFSMRIVGIALNVVLHWKRQQCFCLHVAYTVWDGLAHAARNISLVVSLLAWDG